MKVTEKNGKEKEGVKTSISLTPSFFVKLNPIFLFFPFINSSEICNMFLVKLH